MLHVNVENHDFELTLNAQVNVFFNDFLKLFTFGAVIGSPEN